LSDQDEWEATGPWEPSEEEVDDAEKAAWSLTRLQWENVSHEDDPPDFQGTDWSEAQMAILEEYDARTLVVGLIRVAGALAMTEEVMLGFPKPPMTHSEAHAEILRRLLDRHADVPPDDWE
jgi:hypothetical protein